jgi:hypothetical protein
LSILGERLAGFARSRTSGVRRRRRVGARRIVDLGRDGEARLASLAPLPWRLVASADYAAKWPVNTTALERSRWRGGRYAYSSAEALSTLSNSL